MKSEYAVQASEFDSKPIASRAVLEGPLAAVGNQSGCPRIKVSVQGESARLAGKGRKVLR